MGEKEIVSVVIPAYNAERFIKDAVTSCYRQTYRPVEIVVVNDGSTDSTVGVVNEVSKSVPGSGLELRLIDIGENKGAANALNVGFSNAKGAHICWLSADDMFIDRKKIETQVAHVNRTKALWSYFRDFYAGTTFSSANLVKSSFLPHLHLLDPLFIRDPDLRLMMLFFRNPINGSSIMIRKKCIDSFGQFDPVTRNVDGDGDLWMRYSALKLKLAASKEASVFYREHATQTSRRKNLMVYGCELTRMRMLLTLEEKGDLIRLVKKFTPYFLIVLQTRLYFGRPFVSEFLFNHILDHSKKFNGVFLKYIRRSLDNIRKHPNYFMLDREKFMKDLGLFMKSQTFSEFQGIFRKNE